MAALSLILMILGLFFLAVAAVGMFRLPDVYARAHALGLTDTLGVLLILLGVAMDHGLTLMTVKLFLILVLLYHLNPIISHATLRAAYRAGLKPTLKAPPARSGGGSGQSPLKEAP